MSEPFRLRIERLLPATHAVTPHAIVNRSHARSRSRDVGLSRLGLASGLTMLVWAFGAVPAWSTCGDYVLHGQGSWGQSDRGESHQDGATHGATLEAERFLPAADPLGAPPICLTGRCGGDGPSPAAPFTPVSAERFWSHVCGLPPDGRRPVLGLRCGRLGDDAMPTKPHLAIATPPPRR